METSELTYPKYKLYTKEGQMLFVLKKVVHVLIFFSDRISQLKYSPLSLSPIIKIHLLLLLF